MKLQRALPYFRIEMSKVAFPAMAAAYAGLNLLSLGSTQSENMQTAQLKPQQAGDSSYQLRPSYNYQFEGGKQLPTKPVTSLNSAFTGVDY